MRCVCPTQLVTLDDDVLTLYKFPSKNQRRYYSWRLQMLTGALSLVQQALPKISATFYLKIACYIAYHMLGNLLDLVHVLTEHQYRYDFSI